MPNDFAYAPEQAELLARHVRDELPKGHLCFLIHEVVERQDGSGFDRADSEEGQKAYPPRLMLKVWLYGFAVNVRSTRKLERRIQEDLGFRFLAGGARPDHKTEDPDQEPGLEVSAEQAEGLRQQMESAPGEESRAGKQSATNPDARILRERGGKFCLGYSGEIAVSEDHFIVAVRVTQNASENASLLPMVAEVERQCRARPQKVLADRGFYSGENLDQLKARGLDGYVPDSNLARELNSGQRARGVGRNRLRHGETRKMRQKLRSREGRKIYLQRKGLVEPVIGTLKEQRGMRRFLRRGLTNVAVELVLAALRYNLTHYHRLQS